MPTKTNVKKISKEFGRDVFNNRTILFLRYLEKFELIDRNKNTIRTIEKKIKYSSKNYELYTITEKNGNKITEESDWVVFRKNCNVPERVKKDNDSKQWKRDKVDKREVAVAFRIKNGKLTKESEGTAYIGVFSFLPIKEVISGLNFIIQGDFLTGAGRSEISRDKLWNYWTAGEIKNLIISKCIPIFLKHVEWKYNFNDILYSDEGGHELINKKIKIPVNSYLKENNILIDKDGGRCSSKNSVKVTESLMKNMGAHDLSILFDDKIVLHTKCKTSKHLKVIEYKYNDIGDLLESNFERLFRLIKLKSRKRDVNWFVKFYGEINKKYDCNFFYQNYKQYNVQHDKFWDSISRKKIILTNRFQLKKPQQCFINKSKLSLPNELKNNTFLVLPRLVSEDTFINFRNYIRVNKGYRDNPDVLDYLTADIIRKKLEDEFVKKLTESKWKRLTKDEKIQYVKMIKDKKDEYSIELDYYKPFLTLLSSCGKFQSPSQLIFSSDYDSEHNFEKIIDYGLIKDENFLFLSSDYLEEGNNKWRWLSFFRELGVDLILEKRKKDIVEKIGISVAMKYEKANLRIPIETGSSQKEKCDIISKDKNNNQRYIEVKSRSDNRWDLELTNNQTRRLYKYGENYYVYIVMNALNNPILKIIKGDKIQNTEYVKISIPYNEWNKKELIIDQYTPFS